VAKKTYDTVISVQSCITYFEIVFGDRVPLIRLNKITNLYFYSFEMTVIDINDINPLLPNRILRQSTMVESINYSS
jgi:hypothetical protein